MASRNQPTPTKDPNEQGISRRQVLARGLVVAIGAAVGVTSALDNCFADRDASSGIKAALDEWQANRRDPYLNERFESLKKVASTGHPEALKAIVDEFLAKDSPKHQDKLLELISPLVAETFSKNTFDDYWINLFNSNGFSKPTLNNCWLGYNVFCSWISEGRLSTVASYASSDESPLAYRIAALRSIRFRHDIPLSFVENLLTKVPNIPVSDRGIFLEAIAKVFKEKLIMQPPPASISKATIPGLMALIDQLNEEQIPQQYLRRVSKIVADIVGSKTVFKNAASWRAYLEDRKTAEALKAEGYAVPDEQTQYFFGVKGYGQRICYVIDISGSMNQEIDISAAKDANKQNPAGKQGPVTTAPDTGGQNSADAPPPALLKPDPNAWLKGLPLDRINTRLDAAKEALKASLRQLPKEAKFSVVVFGDEGRILGSPNQMIEATPVKVQAMCLAVDRLVNGGQTNLHRGLELAFSFANEGSPRSNSSIPLSEESPDVIFVLSDGAATQDSYTMTKTSPRTYLFQNPENLSNSVVHGNLLLGAELNLVSFGKQANSSLETIARYNQCKVTQVGE